MACAVPRPLNIVCSDTFDRNELSVGNNMVSQSLLIKAEAAEIDAIAALKTLADNQRHRYERMRKAAADGVQGGVKPMMAWGEGGEQGFVPETGELLQEIAELRKVTDARRLQLDMVCSMDGAVKTNLGDRVEELGLEVEDLRRKNADIRQDEVLKLSQAMGAERFRGQLMRVLKENATKIGRGAFAIVESYVLSTHYRPSSRGGGPGSGESVASSGVATEENTPRLDRRTSSDQAALRYGDPDKQLCPVCSSVDLSVELMDARRKLFEEQENNVYCQNTIKELRNQMKQMAQRHGRTIGARELLEDNQPRGSDGTHAAMTAVDVLISTGDNVHSVDPKKQLSVEVRKKMAKQTFVKCAWDLRSLRMQLQQIRKLVGTLTTSFFSEVAAPVGVDFIRRLSEEKEAQLLQHKQFLTQHVTTVSGVLEVEQQTDPTHSRPPKLQRMKTMKECMTASTAFLSLLATALTQRRDLLVKLGTDFAEREKELKKEAAQLTLQSALQELTLMMWENAGVGFLVEQIAEIPLHLVSQKDDLSATLRGLSVANDAVRTLHDKYCPSVSGKTMFNPEQWPKLKRLAAEQRKKRREMLEKIERLIAGELQYYLLTGRQRAAMKTKYELLTDFLKNMNFGDPVGDLESISPEAQAAAMKKSAAKLDVELAAASANTSQNVADDDAGGTRRKKKRATVVHPNETVRAALGLTDASDLTQPVATTLVDIGPGQSSTAGSHGADPLAPIDALPKLPDFSKGASTVGIVHHGTVDIAAEGVTRDGASGPPPIGELVRSAENHEKSKMMGGGRPSGGGVRPTGGPVGGHIRKSRASVNNNVGGNRSSNSAGAMPQPSGQLSADDEAGLTVSGNHMSKTDGVLSNQGGKQQTAGQTPSLPAIATTGSLRKGRVSRTTKTA